MSSHVISIGLRGSTVFQVDVLVEVSRRLPAVEIIGLPAGVVRETATRIRSAVEAAGFEWPRSRIVFNVVAPPEAGPAGFSPAGLDLALALALLTELGHVTAAFASRVIPWGALTLEGRVRPVRGTVAAVREAVSMARVLLCAPESVELADLAVGYRGSAIGINQLSAAVGLHLPPGQLSRLGPSFTLRTTTLPEGLPPGLIAASESQSPVLLVGERGATLLAKAATGLLPSPDRNALTEIAVAHDAAGLGVGQEIAVPFRAPHHTIGWAAMFGGAHFGVPNELELSKHGVLFLDDCDHLKSSMLNPDLVQNGPRWVLGAVEKMPIAGWPGYRLFQRAIDAATGRDIPIPFTATPASTRPVTR